MLTNTFCHVPSIGLGTERRLWEAGLHSWQALSGTGELPVSKARAATLRAQLRESLEHLADGDAGYFSDRLRSDQHWRMFREFQHSVAYLDIETTGLGGPGDYVTTIALYDGRSIRTYVRDRNLSDFQEDIRDYRLIVTYNGKCFDLPFLREFLGVRLQQAHIDLRYALASLGYRGGLKGCERQLGIDRGELDGVDGYFGVLLWMDFLRHDNERALETLLAYNTLDVVNLETLMVHAYNLKIAQTPFASSHRLPMASHPEIPFKPDPETIGRIRSRIQPW